MSFADIIQSIEDSSIGTLMREGATAFPWMESTHVLAIVIVLGTIAIVDLRLVGFPSHRRGARQLITEMLPFTWVAFVAALITGVCLFTAHASQYAFESRPFQFKMVVLALAGLNMAFFHLTAYRRIIDWDDRLPTPGAVKLAGLTSLTLWIIVVFLGRWIGFSAPFA